MRLEGTNIYLTSITYEDTEDIVRWRNSKEIQEQFIYRQEFTTESHNKWMKNKVETGEVEQFIIWDKVDNKKIGSVYIQDIDYINKKCEYGIFIGELDYQGRGIGKECYKLLFDHVFDTLKLNKISVRILCTNMKSIKCAEKMGFVLEGTFVDEVWLDNKPMDVVFMAKFREQ